MKTLRQELKERGFEPETRIILEAVQRWLKQKPSDYTDGFGYEYLDKDRLLRELKEK